MKQIRSQTVDAAILGFAESPDASEPMFAYEDREVPGKKEGCTYSETKVGSRGGGG